MILQHLPKDSSGRYPGIDIFRGLAIFTMLAANSAAESLVGPHHFLFRVYGSFAAPIFIFLAGFMVGIGYQKHSLGYFVKRGLEVIIIGVLIDIFIWGILPFTTFDVLYLIGMGIPLAAFTLKLKTPIRIFLCLSFFAMGPILQYLFFYEPGLHEFSVSDFSFSQFPGGIKWWLKSCLFDGWFPVFPWMGFILMGTLVFTHGSRIIKNVGIFIPLGIILFIGGLAWLYFHRPLEEREGYSELFYAPGIAYICSALGAITIGVSFLKFLKPVFGLQLLGFLGSASLFIYIFHSAIIMFVLDEYFTELNTGNYLLMYAIFALVMISIAYGLLLLKGKTVWKKVPKFLRFIFGG